MGIPSTKNLQEAKNCKKTYNNNNLRGKNGHVQHARYINLNNNHTFITSGFFFFPLQTNLITWFPKKKELITWFDEITTPNNKF